jgi:poly(3-hydroxybutyrate) depolymerase
MKFFRATTISLFAAAFSLLFSLSNDSRAAEALSRKEAASEVQKLWTARATQLKTERAAEMEAMTLTNSGKVLHWQERVFGEAPLGGRSLWISMHGGGNAPARVNNQQWTNQVRLYEPAEGIYVAPRAPTDTWNLWHEAHIDPMFDRLIANYVALRGVNPDRVYLMGYSAGGDGVWQLAPRMADRFAAAAMMAGHPNGASMIPLRNLPFAIFMGGEDSAYDRNKIATERARELDLMALADPGGYEHFSRIHPGLPHWMSRKDAEAVPWMASHTRHAWPRKLTWIQDDVTHARFYWLAVPPSEAREGRRIDARVEKQTIYLQGDVPKGLTVRLSDELVNLNKSIRVLVNGREAFKGRVKRTREAIRTSIEERADPRSAATAAVVVN